MPRAEAEARVSPPEEARAVPRAAAEVRVSPPEEARAVPRAAGEARVSRLAVEAIASTRASELACAGFGAGGEDGADGLMPGVAGVGCDAGGLRGAVPEGVGRGFDSGANGFGGCGRSAGSDSRLRRHLGQLARTRRNRHRQGLHAGRLLRLRRCSRCGGRLRRRAFRRQRLELSLAAERSCRRGSLRGRGRHLARCGHHGLRRHCERQWRHFPGNRNTHRDRDRNDARRWRHGSRRRQDRDRRRRWRRQAVEFDGRRGQDQERRRRRRRQCVPAIIGDEVIRNLGDRRRRNVVFLFVEGRRRVVGLVQEAEAVARLFRMGSSRVMTQICPIGLRRTRVSRCASRRRPRASTR